MSYADILMSSIASSFQPLEDSSMTSHGVLPTAPFSGDSAVNQQLMPGDFQVFSSGSNASFAGTTAPPVISDVSRQSSSYVFHTPETDRLSQSGAGNDYISNMVVNFAIVSEMAW